MFGRRSRRCRDARPRTRSCVTDRDVVVGERGEAPLQGRPAHRVHDHVDPAPVGPRPSFGDEVRVGIVDSLVETQLVEAFEFLVARGGGEHPSARTLRQLDGRDPDAAGPGVDQLVDRPSSGDSNRQSSAVPKGTGTQAASSVERPSGINQANGSGLLVSRYAEPSNPTVTTRGGIGSPRCRPRGPRRRTGTRRCEVPVRSRRAGGRARRHPRCYGLDSDQEVRAADYWIRDLFVAKDLGPAGLVVHGCFHGDVLPKLVMRFGWAELAGREGGDVCADRICAHGRFAYPTSRRPQGGTRTSSVWRCSLPRISWPVRTSSANRES